MAVSTYFKKKRAFASSLASVGAGVGVLILAPTISFLEKKFGWGYTMIMLSALMLACIPFSLLFRPISNNKCARPDIQDNEETLGTKYGGVATDSTEETTTCTSHCILLMRKMMPKCPEILYDVVFITCLLSNFFMNIGFAVPFVYTVVSMTLRILSPHNSTTFDNFFRTVQWIWE